MAQKKKELLADLSTVVVLKEGNTAVITGSSSGIGRAAAVYCSSVGMNVWMADIDGEDIKIAKELVVSKAKNKDQKIESRKVDVSDLEQIKKLAEEVFANNGKCHFLMNNAGIGGGGKPFSDVKLFQKVFNVNTWGPIYGCSTFIPKMKAMNEPGIIVNTGSKQGITCPPSNLPYNMSKTALKCYTEGIENELGKERREKDGKLKLALLVPGWVNTSIHLKLLKAKAKEDGDESKFDPNAAYFSEEKPKDGAWMPNQVIEFMVKCLDKNMFYIICPDNETSRELDNIRMTWTMQDITKDRQPLSRWHPDYKDKWEAFLKENSSNKSNNDK